MSENTTSTPPTDCDFDDAPLMLTLAHVSFTQSPEIIDKISDVKGGLASLDLPIAQKRQQASFSFNPAGGTAPSVTQSQFWWFSNLQKSRAVAVASNSIVLYDASYGRFSDFISRVNTVTGLIEKVAGSGCFLRSVALRYISGFSAGGSPSPYLVGSLHGLPVERLQTEHFHHQYNFWCTTESDGRLVVNVKTVHGNDLVPKDVVSAGIAIDEKFSLQKDTDAVQLDIHETVKKKTMDPLSEQEVAETLARMRQHLKTAFLAATTQRAHQKWKISVPS